MSDYEDKIARLEARRSELEKAQQQTEAAKLAYEQAAQEIQQSLPRITPDVIAAFREFEKAQDSYGELDTEHHPTAWKLIVRLGLLINPAKWERWIDKDGG